MHDAAARTQGANNLKQLALGMHIFHDSLGRLPPAVAYSQDGKPLYSWRVLLLPFVEQRQLFSQFKLDEAWDGPHNKTLLAQMPRYPQPGRSAGTTVCNPLSSPVWTQGRLLEQSLSRRTAL